MKKLTLLSAALALLIPSVSATAEPPEGRRNGVGERQRGPEGEGRRERGGEGRQRGGQHEDGHHKDGQHEDGPREGRGILAMEPSEMAETMMGRFDLNGDQKLDQSELAALLTEMRERRGSRVGGPREGGPREGGPRGEGMRDGGPREGGPRGEGMRDGEGGRRGGEMRDGGPRRGGPANADRGEGRPPRDGQGRRPRGGAEEAAPNDQDLQGPEEA